jgi:hypothetical protein
VDGSVGLGTEVKRYLLLPLGIETGFQQVVSEYIDELFQLSS